LISVIISIGYRGIRLHLNLIVVDADLRRDSRLSEIAETSARAPAYLPVTIPAWCKKDFIITSFQIR
jgi:hypothetical protein